MQGAVDRVAEMSARPGAEGACPRRVRPAERCSGGGSQSAALHEEIEHVDVNPTRATRKRGSRCGAPRQMRAACTSSVTKCVSGAGSGAAGDRKRACAGSWGGGEEAPGKKTRETTPAWRLGGKGIRPPFGDSSMQVRPCHGCPRACTRAPGRTRRWPATQLHRAMAMRRRCADTRRARVSRSASQCTCRRAPACATGSHGTGHGRLGGARAGAGAAENGRSGIGRQRPSAGALRGPGRSVPSPRARSSTGRARDS